MKIRIRGSRLAWALAVPALLAASAMVSVRLATAALERWRYPPPGRLIDVDGYRLHLDCRGQGTPTVVLESGLGTTWVDWRLVEPAIAAFARVCQYERAGYGWSDPGPRPRTATRMAEELGRLLDRSGEPAPYLVIGHSFGALVARLFAARFPERVAGLLLLDPAPPDPEPIPDPAPRRLGLGTGRLRSLWRGPAGLPEELRGASPAVRLRYLYGTPSRQHDTVAAELASLGESAAQVRAAVEPAGLPQLTLAPAGSPTPPGRRVSVTPAGGHFLQLEDPGLVIDALRRLAREASASGTRR